MRYLFTCGLKVSSENNIYITTKEIAYEYVSQFYAEPLTLASVLTSSSWKGVPKFRGI